jgi:glucosamine--fructose-6-phosphate aminotransferase (isomerizing)
MEKIAGSFTREEIYSQPEAWTEALEVLQELSAELRGLAEKGYTQVVFTGCGSTYYLSIAGAALLQGLAGVPSRGLPASEIWLNPKLYFRPGERALLVAVSRSGETTETLRACATFRQGGYGDLLTFSCYPQRALATAGKVNVVLPSGQEESVAQTRAFSTLYLGTLYLAALWAQRTDVLQALPELARACSQMLAAHAEMVTAVGSDLDLERFYFLGSAYRYGLACEVSLKMKEMTLSHSEPFHFMEFRHGPMSMINSHTLVTGLISQANRLTEAAVLADMHKLGARLLIVGSGLADIPAEYKIEFPAALDEIGLLPLYLPLIQLMAFHRSLAKGLNPDLPTNLSPVVFL